tara:strand:- start:107 stop:466 length:360 start_codon:yes stop_codon:yes gene_type:complete
MSYSQDLLTKISQSIVANQVAMDLSHEIRFTKYFKMNMKSAFKKYEWHLLEAERKEFEMIYEKAQEETEKIHFGQTQIIKEIISLGADQFEDAIEAIKALKNDPKRLNSITKRINDETK